MPKHNLSESWTKIEKGLASAKVPPSQILRLKQEYFSEDFSGAAQTIIDSISTDLITKQDADAKNRRNLARALNFALGLAAYSANVPHKVNVADRKTILAPTTTLATAEALVRKAVENALRMLGSGDSKVMLPPVTPEPPPVTPGPTHLVMPAGPTARALDPVKPRHLRDFIGKAVAYDREHGAAARKAVLVDKAAEAMRAEGAARKERIETWTREHTGDTSVTWERAQSVLRREFEKNRTVLNANREAITNAIQTAYEKFNANVTDTQAGIRARTDLLKKLFSGLKQAPPPLSLIGLAGELVVRPQVDAKLDPRNGLPQLTVNNSGFMQKLVDKLKQAQEKLHVGPRLEMLETKSSLFSSLERVCNAQLDTMERVFDDVCNEHFGDVKSSRSTYLAFKEKAIGDHQAGIRGRIGVHGEARVFRDGKAIVNAGQTAISELLDQRIADYKDELVREIAQNLTFKPIRINFQDFEAAIEMSLYCSYIASLFETDARRRAFDLAEPLVAFLANPASPWSILAAGDHQADAVSKHKLSWKGGTNHKRALYNFCLWYSVTINPFLMVAGVMQNGKVYSPALIQELCRERIDRINMAIQAGRTQGMFGSSWDWQKIDAAFSKS